LRDGKSAEIVPATCQPDLIPPGNRASVLVTGGLCAAVGLTALAGWYTHTAALVQIRQGLEPIWPNGALCFLLLGAALLLAAADRPKTSALFIAVMLAAAALTGIEYLFGIDLRIDRALVEPFLTVGWHQGRMAPNPVVLFLLAGAAMRFGSFQRRRPARVAILGSIILANGLIGVIGHLAAVPTYGWWRVTHMPPIDAIGFTILGAGFVTMAWYSKAPGEPGTPGWLPAAAGVFSLAATFYLWQGLQGAEDRHLEHIQQMTAQFGAAATAGLRDDLMGADTVLPDLALVVGIILSTLLVAATYFAQVSRRRERAAEAARREAERAIAGREKAEKQLGLTEEQRLLALEASGMGTCSWDDAGGELTWDARGEALLGLAGETPATYAAFLNAVHPEDREDVRTAIETQPHQGTGSFRVEFRVVWPNRDVRWITFRGRPRGQGVAVDVTERKLAEQALRRSRNELESLVAERTQEIHSLNSELERGMRELTAVNHELEAFTYSVSHDLRAPLRHIDGFSRILLNEAAEQLNVTGRRALDRIRHAAQQMVHMIDDLLALSRMGRKEVTRQPTDLRAVVDESLELLKPAMEGRDIDLRIGPLPSIDCDPALLEHVTVNLLSNAIKFTRGKTPAIIEVGHMTDHEIPVIYVRDNGVGFDMRFADKLFGIFQRLHRREDYDGVGVGLATVQRIVNKHGGRIWAESEPDKGTTFYFTLNSPVTQETLAPRATR
jgi:signal transduction histidine kinase